MAVAVVVCCLLLWNRPAVPSARQSPISKECECACAVRGHRRSVCVHLNPLSVYVRGGRVIERNLYLIVLRVLTLSCLLPSIFCFCDDAELVAPHGVVPRSTHTANTGGN